VSLFRPEAIDAQRQGGLGSIHLTRLFPLWVAAAFACGAVVAATGYLTLADYTRKARVSGQLVPDRGLSRVLAPQFATVVESHAAEGKAVRRDDVLFVLDVAAASTSGDTHLAVREGLAERRRQLLDAAQRQQLLDTARRAALDQQVGAMQRELAQIDAEVALQRQRLELAQQAQRRLESLRGEQFVSAAQVQAKSEELIGLQAALQSAQRQAAAQQRQIAALESERQELPLRSLARQGEIERELALLSQQAAENDARQRIVVRAPHDGVLGGVVVQAGQTVTAGAVLASVLPAHAQLQAQLLAPSSAIGFVREQQEVVLRYHAFPYQKFGHQTGRVVEVSRAPLATGEAGGGSEPMYRITVALERQTMPAYGQALPLAPGMRVDADVLLDRRRLIEWIFEPVLGLAGRV
jgi:membrane fusion protein